MTFLRRNSFYYFIIQFKLLSIAGKDRTRMKYIQFIWPKRGCIKYNTSISQCKMLKANTSTYKGQPLTHPKDMYNVMVSYSKKKNKTKKHEFEGGWEGNFLHSASKQHSNYVLI